jgi:uncharacterized membrane protein (UPF0127 family)
MRRFESTRSVRLRAPSGRQLEAWVAETLAARLAGLAALPGLAPGRALLFPCCRSLHTVGMRFPIDVAFLSWPPEADRCEVMAVRAAVAPFRIVAAPGLPHRRVAALEAAAGALTGTGAFELSDQVRISTRNGCHRGSRG